MPNHKVFMAIDNISDASLSIEAAQSYLSAGFKEGSMILLTARSPVILKRLLREEGGLLKHVPILEDEEAMGILLKLTYVEVADLTCAEREVARHCISKCCFGSTYHPLALQAFGTYLFDKFGPHLLKWNEIPDFRDTTGREVEEVFSVFELSFKDLSPRYIKIFMLVALYLPHSLSRQSLALSWLAVLCNERTGCIHDVINHLKKKGLIEEDNSSGHVRVHDLIRDFAESKANESWRSWCCLRGVEEVTTCFKQSLCLEGIKFSNCSFGSLPLSSFNFELFANVVVLNLENICQLRSLNLCSMKVLRSLVIRDCGELKEIEGIEHSPNLAWIEVAGFNQLVKAPQIEGLTSLRRFCWDTQRRRQPMGASVDAPTTTRLGDVGKCVLLEYIDIACESLQEFPNLEGLPNLREIHFRDWSEVVNGCPQRQHARLEDNPGLTDASNSTRHSRLHDAHLGGCSTMTIRPKLGGCSQLQLIWLEGCFAMTAGPDLSGCSQLRHAWFLRCSAMTSGPHLSGCLQLQDVSFRGCSAMTTGPDLSGCSQLQRAGFRGCSAMTTGPDFSGCSQLQRAGFRGCSAMITAPDLSACSQLQCVSFHRCSAMIAGPDLSGCSQLQRASFDRCSAMTVGPDLNGCSQLQIVSFDGCSAMTTGPDLSGCLQLQIASFDGCSAMSIGPGLRRCAQLQRSSFDGCSAMITGPDLSGCSQLQRASFDGCSAMTTVPHLSGCSQLQYVLFRGCSAMTAGPDLSGFSQLRNAFFEGCSAMTCGPDLSGCSEIRKIRFEGCSAMTAGPHLSGCSQLRKARFEGCSAMTTSPNLSGCSRLQLVLFDGCSAMTAGPDLSGCSQLQRVSFDGCSAMTTSPDLSGCSKLLRASFDGCSAMTTGPDLSGCSQLQLAYFRGFPGMSGGLDVGTCTRLTFLCLQGLQNLGFLNRLTALRLLELIECDFNDVIDITNCKKLEDLRVTKCQGLTTLLFSFADLSSLRTFTLRDCEGVVDPPDVTKCRHIENVEIRSCPSLTRFPSFEGLRSLKRLVLRECGLVDTPPDVSGCTGLQELELRENPKMERLPWMLDCTCLSHVDVSWGIAVDPQRTPQQLRTCPIFRNAHCLTKRFGLYSLANKYYRFATIQLNRREPQVLP